jgi:solute:Na+ symporter, SSS family
VWVTEQAKVGRVVEAGNFSAWEWVRLILGSEFTFFSATIGAIMGNMAAFGTDQDMVQRLLTAETYQKSRRSLITAAIMDLPIASAFAFIGVLLYVYYQLDPTYMPKANKDVFGSYILNVMPVGIRGLVLAGVFATAMGSLSAALNALATSAVNDWYIPYAAKHKSEAHHVAAARIFTTAFAFLMILIATAFAYVTIVNPDVRIIPVVIGVAGLFLGPMLGVFLIGMLTKSRGSDAGNILAITVALVSMIFLSGQHIDFMNLVSGAPSSRPLYKLPEWMPVIKWTWFAMFGALITLAIGLLFATPRHMVESARRKREGSHMDEDIPLALRR